MSVLEKRIEEDIKKIKQLQGEYPSIIDSVQVHSQNDHAIRILLNIPTAQDSDYPRNIQKSSDIRIELTARYPFDAPKVSVKSPIWNPNIYESGLICLGNKWLPTQGLELLVLRVMQILALDPLIINTSSPAHREANSWYLHVKSQNPRLFPTVDFEKMKRGQARPTIKWKPIQ